MIKKFQKLSIKELTGNINKDEKRYLENWLAESKENEKEYEKIKAIWEKSANYKIPGIPNVEDEWKVLYEKMKEERSGVGTRGSIFDEVYAKFKAPIASKWRPAYNIGLGLILLCAGIITWNSERSNIQLLTVGTGNKETKEILLSDGSLVKLNNGSNIQYLEKFDSKIREVKLTGEAFFSVTKNSTPFVVITENARISVLGTKFDVCARGEKTQVVVKEGKVSLAPKENNAGVYLTKDQLSSITKNSNPDSPKGINADYMLGWMNGKLVFNQTPLKEIVEELDRFYDVNISIEGNNITTNTLTGSFKNRDIDSALTMICLTMNLNFEKHGDVFLIKAKK